MSEDVAPELTRDELYERVWSEPMRTLAARYGISDVAVAKLCRKIKIPLPGRGYWAKRAYGKERRRPPLPRVSGVSSEEVVLSPRTSRSQAQPPSSDVSARQEHEADPSHRIIVTDVLTDPCREVRRTAAVLKKAKQGSRGFLWATAQQGDKPSLDLQVTGTTLDRALRIMDALIKGITARGYSLTISPGPPARTAAEVLGEVIEFRLEEKISQVEHVLTPAERADKLKYGWSSVPAHDDAPTGALTLRLRAEPYSRTYAGIRQSWRDGKRQRVEDCLNDFVVALVLAAEAKKVERARIEALHQRWAVEARERAERERLRLEEEARIKALEHQSAVWSKVAEIRSYLAAVRAAVERQGEIIEAGSALDEWLRWAEAHVDQCDPVRALLARTSLVNTTEARMVRPAPLSTGDEQA